ncbi:MAG TPA: alcohol dehydrogenase catalytic domain-containing protein [Acidimicrobiales bacterium]|nr:alcohol dehydrogenase catalytic domain-containing protein [Acidimicrobiales bacterium]
MNTPMQRVRLSGNRQATVEEVDMPTPQGDQVVVRVRASALCGSDLHGLYRPEKGSPFTPGHEIAGEVVAVDRAVRARVGDRVALHAPVGCGQCSFCRRGAMIMCSAGETLGFSRDGGDAEYVVAPERVCLPLPDAVSFEVATLIGDGVGTPYRALMKAGGIRADQVLGIFGLGPVGLGAAMLGVRFGARVIGVDVNAGRLALAQELGVDHLIDASCANVVPAVRELTRGVGVDVAMECAGSDATLRYALDACRHFGHVALVGEHREGVATIDPSLHFLGRELTMTGTRYYHLPDYEEILALIEDGLCPERMVTHRFSLSDAPTAFALFDAGRTAKALLLP